MIHLKVAFVILNWNRPEITIRAINSILEHERSILNNINVIVVDNGSIQEIREQLIEFFQSKGWRIISEYDALKGNLTEPSNVLILNNENYGYAKGNNIGLKCAKKMGFKYAVVMNNDVILKEPVIDKLLPIMAKDSRIAVLGPRIIGPNGKDQGPYERPGLYNYFLFPFFFPILYPIRKLRSWMKRKKLQEKVSKDGFAVVYRVVGCFMLVDLEKLEQVGWFDENTFLYMEELILAEKLSSVGYKMAYTSLVSVHHEHEVSTRTFGLKKFLIGLESSLYYFKVYRKFGPIRLFLIKVGVLYRTFILVPVFEFIKNNLRKIKMIVRLRSAKVSH